MSHICDTKSYKSDKHEDRSYNCNGSHDDTDDADDGNDNHMQAKVPDGPCCENVLQRCGMTLQKPKFRNSADQF